MQKDHNKKSLLNNPGISHGRRKIFRTRQMKKFSTFEQFD